MMVVAISTRWTGEKTTRGLAGLGLAQPTVGKAITNIC